MEKKISVHCDSEGRTNQLCPYARNELGVVIMGDYQCRRCEYYRGKDETARTISCSHPAGHTIKVYATDEDLRERWRHINLLKREADTMFDEEDNVDGVKVWSVSQAKEIAKEILSMEKKKAKMTKAGAFEWLKYKKVAVVGDACALQTKLFEIGYKWCDGTIEAIPMVDFLFIDDETFQFTESLSHFKNCAYGEISAADILSIEIVDGEDNIAEKNAFLQARDIMKWLREKQSPHTLMIIDSNHVELLDGVKSEVWKEDME